MNIARYIGAAIAVFIFLFIYQWIVHGFFLMDMYEATSHVWRNFSEMNANMPISILIQLILAFWLTFAFSQIYPKGGFPKGLLFGIFFGVFAGILMGSWYLWLPIPAKLGWSWLAAGIGEGIGSGLILGAIYQK